MPHRNRPVLNGQRKSAVAFTSQKCERSSNGTLKGSSRISVFVDPRAKRHMTRSFIYRALMCV